MLANIYIQLKTTYFILIQSNKISFFIWETCILENLKFYGLNLLWGFMTRTLTYTENIYEISLEKKQQKA